MPARIAVREFIVPGLLAQQRQTLFNVRPAVRIAFGLGGQRAGVEHMRVTHVVGRQCKPDPLLFRHRFRHFRHHILQITRAAANALFRVGAIRQAETLRRILGEHHQATHAGG
ncbi:hypothetical protein D3C72_1242570 [compost metagenome]